MMCERHDNRTVLAVIAEELLAAQAVARKFGVEESEAIAKAIARLRRSGVCGECIRRAAFQVGVAADGGCTLSATAWCMGVEANESANQAWG